MLIFNQLDAVALSFADARRRLEELIVDRQWLQLTEMIANDQPRHIRARALTSLRTGGQHHLINAQAAAAEFRLLADYYLQATNQSMTAAHVTPACNEATIPHKSP